MVKTIIRLKALMLIAALVCSTFVFSAKGVKNNKNSINVEKIKSKFLVAPYYINEYSILSVSNRNTDRNSIIYKPNIRGSLGAKLGYRFISFSFAFRLPQSDLQGNTKATKIELNIQKRIFGFSIFYSSYKGMYLKNPDDFGINYDAGYLLRPDIKLTTVGFQTNFIFSRKFSINAAFEQNERQKESAGSFMITLGDRFMNIKADSSFIIRQEQQYYDESNGITNININNIKFAPGAGYTMVFNNNISLTAIVLAGFDLQMNIYKQTNDYNFRLGLPFFIQTKTAFGYNGDLWFGNFIYNIEYGKIKFPDSKFSTFSNYFKISIGRRFG